MQRVYEEWTILRFTIKSMIGRALWVVKCRLEVLFLELERAERAQSQHIVVIMRTLMVPISAVAEPRVVASHSFR